MLNVQNGKTEIKKGRRFVLLLYLTTIFSVVERAICEYDQRF